MKWDESKHPRASDGKFTDGAKYESEDVEIVSDAEEFSGFNSESIAKKSPLAIPEGADLRAKIRADTDGKMTIDEIVNHPLIQEASDRLHTDRKDFTSNINTPERNLIRHEVAEKINARGSISGKNAFAGEVKKEFRAEIVIGVPAGGKSSVIVDKVSKNTGSRILDSDEIKALLPEFDGGNGAGKVHEESADIILNGMVMPEYYKGGSLVGDNIVIPIVGKNAKNAILYLAKLKEAGYSVHLSFNDVTPLNSAKRATTRYIETGRFLAPNYIREVGTLPQSTYEQLKKQGGFDSYSKYDNNVPFGQPAKKVERIDGKGNNLNWEEWQ